MATLLLMQAHSRAVKYGAKTAENTHWWCARYLLNIGVFF